MTTKAALVFHCCSVVAWGYPTELCWCCGQVRGKDSWGDPMPQDEDAMLARKYTVLTDIQERRPVL